MKINLSIIMDELVPYKPESHVIDKNIAFSAVNILPTRRRVLHVNHIYIGKLSDIFSAEWRTDDIYCVAVRDRIKDDDETEERLKNIIVLNSNCDVLDVFTAIQRCFFKIIEWNEKMKDYLIQNRSMQDFLNLSEDIIGNYITVSDSSFSLVACTSGLSCEGCPTTSFLVENGYHSAEKISTFNKLNMPERWSKATDIYVNNNPHISIYDYANKVVRYNNTYFAHVIMLFNYKPASDGLLDLFRMLLNNLMIFFERQWNQREGSLFHIYDRLIGGLIEEELSTDIIAERVRYSGLPLYSNFRFIKVSIECNVNVMLQRMGRDFIDHIPESKVTVFKESLAVLLINPVDTKGWFEQKEKVIEEILERYGAKCGISDSFNSLVDLKNAYEQAEIALKYGSHQSFLPFSGNASMSSLRMFSYESYYPCYLISSNPNTARLAQTTKASTTLKKLYEYDKQHGTNNLELLYVYLNNDRKATETSNIIHMHRNNVIYRINRICEMFDLDLDDSRVRFRLLLAYEIFSPVESI